jgi:hypothetical protein
MRTSMRTSTLVLSIVASMLLLNACSMGSMESMRSTVLNEREPVIDYGARIPNMPGDWARFCKNDKFGAC